MAVVPLAFHSVKNRSMELVTQLTELWEASVRATHHFLSENDICEIRSFLPMTINNVCHLVIATDAHHNPVAFMGIENGMLEMLFVNPSYIGVGIGHSIVQYGIDNFDIKEVTVNEQNPYFVGYFYNLTHSISYRLRIYISHPQQTCTKIAIKKSNEGGARAYWQVGFEIIDVFLFRLPSHLSLGWSCFLSNVCPRISSCFGLIIWHKAVRFDIFSNRR